MIEYLGDGGAILMDKSKIEQAVRLLLEGIGENPDREGLADTPSRIAGMCEELFSGMGESPEKHLSKTFTADNNELIVEKDITFYSLCEHHLLPFYGKVHIAYVPDGKVVGISKLARTVEVYVRRAQIQEQLTGQIADAIMEYLKPCGAAVVIEAEHMCMTMRGVKKPGTKTVTMAVRGCMKDNSELKNTFLDFIK